MKENVSRDAETVKMFFGGNIITMEGNGPNYAEAVVIKGDAISFVGSKEDALRFKDGQTEIIDLAGKTMFPGFIDPHIHHAACLFFYVTNIRADDDWGLPGIQTAPVLGYENYLAKLKEADEQKKDPNEWLIVLGYASYYHGKISRDDLDKISLSRPIMLFQRSFHEAFLNSKALEILNFTRENNKDPNIDIEQGRVVEEAVQAKLYPFLLPIILKGDNWRDCLTRSIEYLHMNGITAVADMMAIDGYTDEHRKVFREIIGGEDVPLRTYMVAEPRYAYQAGGNEAAIKFIDEGWKKDIGHLKYLKHVKIFADGAFFAQLMRIKGGYTDGHQGVWITPVDLQKKIAEIFWGKEYPIHVHVNGDEGLDVVLSMFEELQKINPKPKNKLIFHHLGYSRPDQMERMKKLNVCVSLLPYYIHALGDIYSKTGLGPEKAHYISRSGSCVKNGITISLHSDFFMCPSNPLFVAWCAVNRIGVLSKEVLGPEERITVHQALKAITIDAAYTFGMDNEIGSIKAGKRADFTILEENPYEVDPMRMKDIRVLAKVFNGRYFELRK
jgi:predicted amidohydrolase YtcJ